MPNNHKLLPEPELKTGIYRHYKGNEYKVHGLVCHSETLEWHVMYEPFYEHTGYPDLWVRPYSMFVENVEYQGKVVPRFTHLE